MAVRRGIRANCVNPGVLLSSVISKYSMEDYIMAFIMAGRMAILRYHGDRIFQTIRVWQNDG
jgi:hypothetical protein